MARMGEMSFYGFRVLAIAAALVVPALDAVLYAEEAIPETDGEIWNRGVDLYRAGNATNALAVLKPLILSKPHS